MLAIQHSTYATKPEKKRGKRERKWHGCAEYIIWWVEIREKLGVKKNEMFVASGVRGCDFSLLFSIGEATSKCTGHLPSAREMWTYKGVKGTGASHPWEKAKTAGNVQSGEEEAQDRSHQCVQIPEGRVQRVWSWVGSLESSPVTGQEPSNTGGSVWTPENAFSTVRVTEHWHGFSREAVELSSLEILSKCLDVVLGIGVDQMPSRGTFQPQPSHDSLKAH